MMAQGYVVVATDYPGLGVPGMIHPYLIGISEGSRGARIRCARRAICPTPAPRTASRCGDTAKAAMPRSIRASLPQATRPTSSWSASRAAAPATYLVELFDADKTSSEGKELTAMTVLSWSRLENLAGDDDRRTGCRAGRSKRRRAPASNRSPEFEAINKDEQPCRPSSFSRPIRPRPSLGRGSCCRIRRVRRLPERRCSSPRAPPTPPSGRRSPSNSAKRSASQGVRVDFVGLPGVTHTFAAKDSAPARWPGWATASGARRRRRAANARTRAGRPRSARIRMMMKMTRKRKNRILASWPAPRARPV